jgi:hypothetical protein
LELQVEAFNYLELSVNNVQSKADISALVPWRNFFFVIPGVKKKFSSIFHTSVKNCLFRGKLNAFLTTFLFKKKSAQKNPFYSLQTEDDLIKSKAF